MIIDGNVTASGVIKADSFESVTGGESIDFKDSIGVTGDLTVSGNVSGSLTSTASFGFFTGDGSGLSNVFEGTTPSASISTRLTSLTDGTATLISGSVTSTGSLGRLESTTLSVNTPLSSSTAIFTNNITTGYPLANKWQENLEGSFFNTFDHTSHVSEILRFMAGVISHSIDTSAPTPNLKFWNNVSTSHTAGSTTA